MEKIININMAGRVIPIEDAAYTLLKDYVESLHAHFAGEEGSDEIMADIESRIAELMDERIKRGAPAINAVHIQEIQLSMGTAQDFATEESAGATTGTTSATASFPQMKKRFVRDEADKMLGGVCSGLAAWLNVDPALVRILFAVLTLGGFGAGILFYIALWIFVPAAPLAPFRGRRLFRNPDDKILGGVAGGLAAYFGKETWIFRLVFGLPLLLSIFSGFSHVFIGPSIVFGSFTGTFIVIYIILWIVLPPAVTDFDKMEMRGEKIDLASIRQNVQTAMGGAGHRMREWGGEVRDSVSRLGGPVRNFTSEAAAAARPIASTGVHVIGLLLRIFLLCVVGAIAFALFAALVVYSFSGASTFVNQFILASPAQAALGWVTLLLFFGVPLIALITWLVRRILKVRSGSRYLGWTFGGLWAIGGICMAAFGTSLAREFRGNDRITTEMATLKPAGNKLLLEVPGEPINYGNSEPWLHGPIRGWDINGDTIYSANVNLQTSLSPDSFFHYRITRYAMGHSREDASARARSLRYTVQQKGDSILSLNSGYAVAAAQKYRGQRVMVEVQVPKGGKLRLASSVVDKLKPSFLVINEDRYYRHSGEMTDLHFLLDPEVDYVMGADGELTDALHPEDETKIAVADNNTRRTISEEDDERRQDSTDRELERRTDSLDREVERLERAKERLEARRP